MVESIHNASARESPIAGRPVAATSREASRVQKTASASMSAVADPRPLVLAVEDEEQVARTLARVLETQFRVAIAPDGLIGLARALELRPDAILTDMMMPRMTGDQLVREVRKRHELDGTPIIVLTAWAEDDLRIRMLREGASDYITKPFSAEELLSRVDNVVAVKRARELLQEELKSKNRDLEALASELVLQKRQLEVALEAEQLARDHAEAASRAKSDFLGLVTHELMTPVTALRLTCQRLARDHTTPLAPPHLAAIERMDSVCSRLAGAIQSLLEHARYESNQLVLERREIDLPALTVEILEELRPQAEQKHLGLELRIQPTLGPLESDPRLLRVVLTNLVSNAVKFTERGQVSVALEGDDEAFQIVVDDTGPGIAEADRLRIFEPFQQLEPLFHKHLPGIGLGLALAREMCEAIGGTVTVSSSASGGARFVVRLPLTPPEASPDATRGAP